MNSRQAQQAAEVLRQRAPVHSHEVRHACHAAIEYLEAVAKAPVFAEAKHARFESFSPTVEALRKRLDGAPPSSRTMLRAQLEAAEETYKETMANLHTVEVPVCVRCGNPYGGSGHGPGFCIDRRTPEEKAAWDAAWDFKHPPEPYDTRTETIEPEEHVHQGGLRLPVTESSEDALEAAERQARCVDMGGHFWPDDAPEDEPSTCTRCGFNPGWKSGPPINEQPITHNDIIGNPHPAEPHFPDEHIRPLDCDTLGPTTPTVPVDDKGTLEGIDPKAVPALDKARNMWPPQHGDTRTELQRRDLES